MSMFGDSQAFVEMPSVDIRVSTGWLCQYPLMLLLIHLSNVVDGIYISAMFLSKIWEETGVQAKLMSDQKRGGP